MSVDKNTQKNMFQVCRVPETKRSILEKCKFFLQKPEGFFHVVSLNPEIIVIAQNDEEFRLSLQSANAQLMDGVGMVLASKLIQKKPAQRFTGVDFMNELMALLQNGSSRVLFLGGGPKIAEKVAECYKKKYSNLHLRGINGIKSINTYQPEKEGKDILQVIHDFKPHIIFSSFGSPFQEKWFYQNRASLQGILCAGVGGAFDFVAGTVPRAPGFVRSLGLEWLFRLVLQPWRWRRQLRLPVFVFLTIKELFTYKK